MGNVKFKLDPDLEKVVGEMAVKAVKEQIGNHCALCGKELDIDISQLADDQAPCCAECASELS